VPCTTGGDEVPCGDGSLVIAAQDASSSRHHPLVPLDQGSLTIEVQPRGRRVPESAIVVSSEPRHDGALGGRCHVFGVELEIAARHLGRGRDIGLTSPLELVRRHVQVEQAPFQVDEDQIAVRDQRDRTAPGPT
jgi:hypothetical protein